MTEKPKEYNLFIKEPIRVLQVLKTVTHEEYVVLSEIASLQSIERGFYMTDESLSLRVGLSADRVGRIIGSLKRKGIVTVVTLRADRFRTERQVRINPAAMPTCGFEEAVARMRAEREAAEDARADARHSREAAVNNLWGIGGNTDTVSNTPLADLAGGIVENADMGIGENAVEVSAETPSKYLKGESLTKESKDTVAFGSGSPSAPISEPAPLKSMREQAIERLERVGVDSDVAAQLLAARRSDRFTEVEAKNLVVEARKVGIETTLAAQWAICNGTFTALAYRENPGLQEGGAQELQASPNAAELDVTESLAGGWIPAALVATIHGGPAHV